VTFVPLAGDDAAVVLVWRPDARSPVLPAFREVVRAVAPTLQLAAAG
jgi:hypothetical protein